MKNKKIFSLPLLCAVLIVAFSFCLNSNAAAAQNVPKEKAITKQQETLKNHKEMEDVSLKQADAGSLKTDQNAEAIKVKKPANENVFKTTSMYNSEDQVFDTSSVLNENNPDDMYFSALRQIEL